MATAYVACGKLALLLALPPGYASAIFPPAGIAVAAALIGGLRTLPWTFCASALLNAWAGPSQTEWFTAANLAAAGAIAAASTLQAAAGGWVLQRFVGYPCAFDRVRDVLGLLFLAPVICLVSASLSVSGLTALGAFGIDAFATNWLTWWIGDTVGVIVMVPIVLAIAGEPRRQWRRRIPTVVVPMALIFSLVVFVFIRANRWEQEESLMEFRSRSQQLADRIQAKFEEQELLLEETDGFLSHDPGKRVTREEFQRAVHGSLLRFPMLQAIEWAPRVEHAERLRFETSQRSVLPDFEIVDKVAGGPLRRAGRRASYFPVTYVEPVAGNRAALGFDLNSTPERQSALARALERKGPVATAPLRLVQEKEEQFGILLLLGVIEGANAPGVVLTVLRMNDFIDKALPAETSSFRLVLTDEETHQTIYGEKALGRGGAAAFRQVLQYGARRYLLQMEPTPAYFARHRGWQSWTVLAVGLFGTGLLGSLLLLGTGYTARVEALVDERTDALAHESYKNRFFLRNASDGVHILDTAGNVLDASDSFCKSLGYRRDELIGMNVRQWDAGFNPEKLRAVISAQLENVEPWLFETKHRRKDGSVFDVEISGMSLELDGQAVLFNSSRDITERKLAQQALREEEEKLRGLFDLSPLGIALTDMSGHFVDFNEAFRRITGYSEPELKELDYWDLTPTSYVNEEQQWLDSLARTGRYGPYEKEYLRKDGRLVPLRLNGILVVARDGRQYIWSIVEDISQWKAAEALLQEQRDFLAASRDELKEAQRISMLGSWVLDVRTGVLTWSDETFRIFEIDAAKFGASYEAFLDAVHPDDRETVDHAYRKSLADRIPYDLVYRLLMPDGRIKHVRERCETHYGEDGTPLISRGTVQDVTQIRETENALRESEQRFRTVADYNYDWEYWRGARREYLYVSPSCERITGYSQQEFIADPGLTERIVHPDDRELVESHLRNYCGEEERSIDFRIVRKDGGIRWIAHGCRPVFGRDGEFIGRRVSNRDITERKHIETALFENEERFRLISASAKDAIVIVGATEEINYWNPAAETIFGYAAGEALGKNLHGLLAPSRYGDTAHGGFAQFAASGEGAIVGTTFETTAIGKGGREFPIELSISALQIKDQWQAVGIARDITDRKEAEAKIRELAYYDTLTNLPNRRLLMDRLNSALSQAKRFQRSLGLVFLDLDDFKQINDTLGHEAGDDLLKGVAARLVDCVRTGDTVCRQGGDEFVVVLTEIAQPADAARVAEKILQAMEQPYRVAQQELAVTTSVGIAVYPIAGTDDAKELMKKADIAMYAAKKAGRNGYKFYEGSEPGGA